MFGFPALAALKTGAFWLKIAPYIISVIAVIGLAYGAYSWAYDRGKNAEAQKLQPILNRALTNITTLKSNQAILEKQNADQSSGILLTKKDADARVAESTASVAAVQKKNKTLVDANKALTADIARRPSANEPCDTRDTLKGAQI